MRGRQAAPPTAAVAAPAARCWPRHASAVCREGAQRPGPAGAGAQMRGERWVERSSEAARGRRAPLGAPSRARPRAADSGCCVLHVPVSRGRWRAAGGAGRPAGAPTGPEAPPRRRWAAAGRLRRTLLVCLNALPLPQAPAAPRAASGWSRPWLAPGSRAPLPPPRHPHAPAPLLDGLLEARASAYRDVQPRGGARRGVCDGGQRELPRSFAAAAGSSAAAALSERWNSERCVRCVCVCSTGGRAAAMMRESREGRGLGERSAALTRAVRWHNTRARPAKTGASA